MTGLRRYGVFRDGGIDTGVTGEVGAQAFSRLCRNVYGERDAVPMVQVVENEAGSEWMPIEVWDDGRLDAELHRVANEFPLRNPGRR